MLRRRRQKKNRLLPWLLLPCGLIFLPMVFTSTTAEVFLAVPVVQLTGLLLIWNHWGPPKSWWDVAMATIANIAAVATTILCWFGLYRYACLLTAGITLRMSIAVGALSCVGVLLLLGETVRRRKLRWRPWVPRVLRMGLACLIAVPILEGTAWVIELNKFQPLPMPGTLSPAAEGEIRVAAVGGSTMLGFPYEPHYSIGHVLTWQLRQMYPQHKVQLENLSVTGANLEQALARLGDLKQKPDLILVYSGHNQFFHRLEELDLARRTSWGTIDDWMSLSAVFRITNPLLAQQLMVTTTRAKDQRLCGAPICPTHLLRTRLQRYVRQLNDFFRWAEENHITIVFCSPVAGESDFEPNLSLGDPDDMAAIEQQWKSIRTQQQKGEWTSALNFCADALQEYPNVAEFHFRAGECFLKLDQPEAARSHFENAINLDQFPIRALDAYRESGMHAARRSGVTVVETENVVRRHAEDGLLNQKFFLDGVHPNLRATYLIGRAVTDAAMTTDAFHRHGKPISPNRLSFAESMQDHHIDSEVLAKAYETTDDVLTRYSDFRPFDRERRLTEAAEYAALAAQLRNGNVVPGEAGTESLDAQVEYRNSHQ